MNINITLQVIKIGIPKLNHLICSPLSDQLGVLILKYL